MLKILKAVSVAFSVYSKIPMPGFDWDSKDMEYCMIFFPFVGAVTGIAEWFLYIISLRLDLPVIFRISVAIVVPLLITGGIHIDGFMDTCDAINSYKPREQKLAILKDPHIGAFSVICLSIYILTAAGFISVINNKYAVAVLCINFFVTRCISGISVVTLKSAKNDGMLFTFATKASKRTVLTALIVEAVIACVLLLYISPIPGLLVIFGNIVSFIYYHHKSYKDFGGITGDLAGFFLSVSELLALVFVGGYCIWF